MGTTAIKATLDAQTIACTYYHKFDPGEDVTPVDLTVHVNHQYVTSLNTVKEITLETITIPKSYLETTGLAYLSEVQQTVEFTISNLRYLNNIVLEVHEIRDGVPLITTAQVINADDSNVEPLPNNPQKDIENDENIPVTVPDINISDPEPAFDTILFSMHLNPVTYTQISKRIYLGDDGLFVLQDYNQMHDRIFVENSITNMLPNPAFLGTANTPDAWSISAPGIIINSHLLASDITTCNYWQIHITNPNLFSAFNSVSVYQNEPANLIAGLNAITFSTYYKVVSTCAEIPFSSFDITIHFFHNLTEISSEQITIPVANTQDTWTLLVATCQGAQIPAGANKYRIDIDITDINMTNLFEIQLYLPQLEPTAYATTRTIDSRIQDKFLTEDEIEFNLPFYLLVETKHIIGPGLRGLFASTTNLKDGIEFQVSSDRLFMKAYTPSGTLINNIASDPFSANEEDIVSYGVWVDTNTIEFYIDNVLISSHTATLDIEQTKQMILGALERSNSTINSELLDLQISRVKPV